MSNPASYIVENIWGCSVCHGSNKGRNSKCSKCGTQKMSESSVIITDPELLAKVEFRPNPECLHSNGHSYGGHKEEVSVFAKLPPVYVGIDKSDLIKPWFTGWGPKLIILVLGLFGIIWLVLHFKRP